MNKCKAKQRCIGLGLAHFEELIPDAAVVSGAKHRLERLALLRRAARDRRGG